MGDRDTAANKLLFANRYNERALIPSATADRDAKTETYLREKDRKRKVVVPQEPFI